MSSPLVSYILLGVAGWVSYEWYLFTKTRNKLSAIPTVGSDTFILSYISAWKFVFSGKQMIQEGYDKYPNGVFKVPTLETSSRWFVVVNDGAFITDIKNAGDEVLSAEEFGLDLLQSRYTLSKADAEAANYHPDSIRNGLTRSLSMRFADIIDEVENSFRDILPATTEWTSYPITKSLLPIVCRTSNRLFVGQPLCQDPEYLQIQQEFATHVMVSAAIVNLSPSFLKAIIGRLITKVPKTFKLLEKFLNDLLEERLQREAEFGKKWEGRPNDLISWLLDYTPAHLRNAHDLTLRIIAINFAAIHTTSMTLSSTLLELASRPEYIEPLRKEVEQIVDAYGWTKEAMVKMNKLDSFIMETSRTTGLFSLSLGRKAMKDFTLSNGTVIPAGVTIAAATASIHNDPKLWDGDAEFNGFRFSDKRAAGGTGDKDEYEQFRHQMVTPTKEFLLFGYGKHACPGRFFAVNEVKSMLAHVLVNYDLKLPDTPNPPAMWIGTQRVLSNGANILLRKRQTT